MKRLVAKLLIAVSLAVAALVAAPASAGAADELCAKVTVWQPVGEQVVCVPLP